MIPKVQYKINMAAIPRKGVYIITLENARG